MGSPRFVVPLVVLGSLWAWADGIHPYTQQNWDEWQGLMTAADEAIAKKVPADDMIRALEKSEDFAAERSQVLHRHPDYEKGLAHQLTLRLSLVKLYANVGFLYAKTAAEKHEGALLTAKGGAFSRLDQAKATLQKYFEAKGANDPEGKKMEAYVAQLRTQVDGVGTQLNAAGVAVAPTSSTPVDEGTQGYFRQWWDLLAEAEHASAAGDAKKAHAALEAAQRHQKGWDGWLKKHSEYAKALERQQAMANRMSAGSVDALVAAAREQSEKGLADKNPNFFGEHSGVHQKLAQAKAALAKLEKNHGADEAELRRLHALIDEAEHEHSARGNQLRGEALASRAMPADDYRGGDKSSLKAQILAYWKQRYPKDKVLAVRFFETNWTRETNWKANANSIYKSDYSWLPVKVVVQTSDEVASLFPAFANKQHMSEDKVVISDDRGGASYVVGEMLMKNVHD